MSNMQSPEPAAESSPQLPPGASVQFELITPAVAEEYLSYNTDNFRTLSQATATRYAKEMAEDLWQQGVGGVSFDSTGVLINGQHQLSAIVMSGKSQWLTVARGLHPSAVYAIDNGQPRNTRQVIEHLLRTRGLLGEYSAGDVTRIWVPWYKYHGLGLRTPSTAKLPNSEVSSAIEKSIADTDPFWDFLPKALHTASDPEVLAGLPSYTKPRIAIVYVIIASAHGDTTAVDGFFEGIKAMGAARIEAETGESREKIQVMDNDPRRVIARMSNDDARKGRKIYGGEVQRQLCALIMAFNFWRENQPRKNAFAGVSTLPEVSL